MAISRETFDTLYTNDSGVFATNSTREISEPDMQEFASNVSSSTVFKNNDFDYYFKACSASGAINAYEINETIPTAYTNGERFAITIFNGNTGACTLNRNGLGAKDLVNNAGDALTSGQMIAGGTYLVRYNGTHYRVLGIGSTVPQSEIQIAEVDISSAEILSGNSSPVQLVAAPGANKMIMPIAIVVKLVWNSIAYATNVSWNTKIGSATSPAIGSNGLLDDTQDSYDYFTIFSGISKTTAEWINQPLYWYVLAGNPINGNSTLKVKVLYRIVTF